MVGGQLPGVQLTTTQHDVIVQGAVIGGDYRVDIGPTAQTTRAQCTLSVASGGLVAANIVVRLLASGNQITNAGDILGQEAGVEITGNGGSSLIQNQGLISGEKAAVVVGLAGTQTMTPRNNGTVAGGNNAYDGQAGTDRIVNRGVMEGAIELGGGNDRFDNRGGRIEDPVYGGAGNDLFTPGADDELLYGGDGFDTLDFRSGGAVRASLRDTNGTGAAQGDLFSEFEQLWGSFSGSDTLIGDDLKNTIYRFGGNDTLVGDRAADVLYGRDGNDRFRFDRLGKRCDRIEDWGRVTDNNDQFVLRASGFEGGFSAGRLSASRFRTRGDNVAQDADDRFVFRTTDRSLWFDADGKGGSAAVLLADLQTGAVVVAGDVLPI